MEDKLSDSYRNRNDFTPTATRSTQFALSAPWLWFHFHVPLLAPVSMAIDIYYELEVVAAIPQIDPPRTPVRNSSAKPKPDPESAIRSV